MNNSNSSYKNTILNTNSYHIWFKDLVFLLLPLISDLFCYWLWKEGSLGLDPKWWIKTDETILAIVLIIVANYLLPQVWFFRMPFLWIVFYLILLSVVAWGGYWMTKHILITLYDCRMHNPNCNDNLVAWSIWKLLGVVGIISMIFFIPIWQFHRTTDGMHILTILSACIATVPASLITLEFWEGKETKIDFVFVYAVECGYPVFWLAIFFGWLSLATAREWI